MMLQPKEHLSGGCLLNFLRTRKGKAVSFAALVRMLRDVSSGMAYMESIAYVHGDLAARNLLMEADDSMTVKIADFGCAAKVVDDGGVWVGHPLPIRWSAPEYLTTRMCL